MTRASESAAPAVAQLTDVTRTYVMGNNEVRALDGFSFSFRRGEYWAVMGSSGSGKSTLLNILGCLDRPTEGQYLVRGTPTSSLDDDALSDLRSRELGFVFQSYNLIPQLDVLENILVPLFYQDDPPADGEERARRLADRVGLASRLDHKPMELSGGQQQRVAIARAIITDPRLFVADEPTGDLDRHSAEEVLELMDRLSTDLGKTIVMVTHDRRAADRAHAIMYLDKGELSTADDLHERSVR